MVLCKLLQDMANDIIQSNCTERQTSEKGNLFPAFSSWWAARMCAHLQNKQLQRQPPESQPQSPSHTHSPHSDVLFHDLFKSWGPWALRKRSFCPNKHNFLFRLQPVLLTGQIATPTMSAHSTLCGKEWREVETWHLGNTYRVAGTVHTQKHPPPVPHRFSPCACFLDYSNCQKLQNVTSSQRRVAWSTEANSSCNVSVECYCISLGNLNYPAELLGSCCHALGRLGA